MKKYSIALFVFSRLLMPLQASEGHKLDGIFTSKITTLSDLKLEDFKLGDIVFMGCESQWYTVDNHKNAHKNAQNIGFLNDLKVNGIPCFCLAAIPYHYKRQIKHRNESYDIKFSHFFEKKIKLDKESILSKGIIYKINSCYPDQQINALLKVLEESGRKYNRAFYISDDTYILSYVVEKTISLPTAVYFVDQAERISDPSRSACRFLLCDQPKAHWAYTNSSEEIIKTIRNNPLILAETFDRPGSEPITYKSVLGFDLLLDSFRGIDIRNSSPLLKTFLLADSGSVYFAQWLKKIYDETIWSDVICHVEKFTNGDAFKDYYRLLLTGLVRAKTIPGRVAYSNQISTLFNMVSSSHLRKSCVQSLNKIPIEDRENAVEKTHSFFRKNELKASSFLASWVILMQMGNYVPFIDLLSRSIPDKVSPFDFLKTIKNNIDNALNPDILEEILNILPKFGENYKDSLIQMKQTKHSLLELIEISRQLSVLRTKLSLTPREETKIFSILVSCNSTQNDIPQICYAFCHLFSGVKRKEYANFSELTLLIKVQDPITRICSALAANSIFTTMPQEGSFLGDLLKKIMNLSSNEERVELASNLSNFLVNNIIRRKEKHVCLGHSHWFEEAVFCMIDIPFAHRFFFFKVMGQVHQNFRFSTWQQISSLCKDLIKVKPDQFEDILGKISQEIDLSRLRKLMGLSFY